MRRKDREMDRAFAEEIIDSSDFGVLSVNRDDGEVPYSVPLSLVRCGENLYFHSAKEGEKVVLLARNKKARIVFVGDVNVPDIYSKTQLDEIITDKEETKKLISGVFTTEYGSAIVEGTVSKVEDKTEKEMVLKLICEKYTPDKMKYFTYALNAGGSRAQVYKIKIETVTAKRKKFDTEGVEMKWGRKNG